MDIVQEGKDEKKNWWVGHKIECKECGCGFTLKREDGMFLQLQKFGYKQYVINCPECLAPNRVENTSLPADML